jgi:hypothetical protein
VEDRFAQIYFNDLHQKKKVRRITLLDGLLRWKQSQIYVPKGKLHIKVMQKVHDVPTMGHHGENKTRESLGKTFYWSEMRKTYNMYVHMCVKCQSTKLVHKKKFRLYKPLLLPSGPFENVLIYFMTCFP